MTLRDGLELDLVGGGKVHRLDHHRIPRRSNLDHSNHSVRPLNTSPVPRIDFVRRNFLAGEVVAVAVAGFLEFVVEQLYLSN